MSAEKGGALVRSPPSLVDTYASHVGPNTGWDEHSPANIPPLKKQQSQKNASVTKLSSGGYKDSNSNCSTVVKSSPEPEIRYKSVELYKEELNSKADEDIHCACGGWAKARQIEYDLHQLQKTHEVILKGLHQQLDDLKQRNRDLTFQLLMGPFANTIKVEAPLSPESDVTPPKEAPKPSFQDERRSNNSFEQFSEEKEMKKLKNDTSSIETKQANNQRKIEKIRSSDPRQAKSLDLELLEEESESLRKQLFEERAKNKYLVNLSEDLKRQIREETGAWCPPPPPSSQRYNYNASLNKINTSSEFSQGSNIFRLPHIDYNSDQKLNSIQEQMQQRELQKVQSQFSKKRKEGSKHSERNGKLVTTMSLPSISKSGDDYVMMKQNPKKNKNGRPNNDIQNEHHSNTDKTKNGPKSHSQSAENISFSKREITGNASCDLQNETYSHHGKDRIYDKKSHRLSNKSVHQALNEYQDNDQPDVEKAEVRVRQRHSKDIQYSVMKENNKTQSPPMQRLEDENTLSKSRNASRRKSGEKPSSLQSSYGNGAYDPHSTLSEMNPQMHLTQIIPYENEVQKQGRKNSNIQERISIHSTYQNNLGNESAAGVPSSSLAGTSPHSSGRGKHRGKNSKKGGKKNRKELHEAKDINQ